MIALILLLVTLAQSAPVGGDATDEAFAAGAAEATHIWLREACDVRGTRADIDAHINRVLRAKETSLTDFEDGQRVVNHEITVTQHELGLQAACAHFKETKP